MPEYEMIASVFFTASSDEAALLQVRDFARAVQNLDSLVESVEANLYRNGSSDPINERQITGRD